MRKKFLFVLVALLSFHVGMAFAQTSEAGKRHRILIAYYSLKGEKKTRQGMMTLEHGFTEQVAMKIHNFIGGDMCHIENKTPYPEAYEELKEVAREERKSGKRPELKPLPVNIDDYDVVFLGYPIWFGTFPPAMFTFLQQYDLSSKTIIPFSTSGATVWGHTLEVLHAQYPGADILEGLELRSLEVSASDVKIREWLESLPVAVLD